MKGNTIGATISNAEPRNTPEYAKESLKMADPSCVWQGGPVIHQRIRPVPRTPTPSLQSHGTQRQTRRATLLSLLVEHVTEPIMYQYTPLLPAYSQASAATPHLASLSPNGSTSTFPITRELLSHTQFGSLRKVCIFSQTYALYPI